MSQRCAGCGSTADLAHYGWADYPGCVPGEAASFSLCPRCRSAVRLRRPSPHGPGASTDAVVYLGPGAAAWPEPERRP